MSRVAAYIDGPLFLNGTRGLGMSMDLDLSGLVQALAPQDQIVKIIYFATLSPASVYPDRLAHEEKILERFAAQGIEIKVGRLEVKAHVSVERGIESGIATAMLIDASTNMYDTAIVISRRPELADPILAVCGMGKHVKVVFYEYEFDPVNALKNCADEFKVLSPELVLKFRRSGPKPVFAY